MQIKRMLLLIAIAICAVETVLVFIFYEYTGKTVTGHVIFSLSYSFWHFALFGIAFAIVKVMRLGAIGALYVRYGGALLVISVISFAVLLNSLRHLP